LIAGTALLIGCAQPKPFEYHSDNEIPEGPGIFTKEAGSFTIYDSKRKASTADKAQAAASGMSTTPENGQAPADAASSAGEAEFREFQQWRKERKDFESFQQWKKSRQGAAEYEEFREWQRWQEYKKWQDSQSKDR